MEINVNGDIKKIDISNEKYSITIWDPHNIDEDVTYTFNIPYYNQPDLTILPMNYQKQISNHSNYSDYQKEKELELKKCITKKSKYHITVLKVSHGYMLCTFDNNTNKQSYSYISIDTFDERYIFGIGEQKPILEFESNIKVNLSNNYAEFSIGDDKLIFYAEKYIHEYIHNGYKYIIPSNIFNKVLSTCYKNKVTITLIIIIHIKI